MSSSFPMRNMRVRFSGETNIGLKRAHNEDSFFLPEEAKLAIVADGMGGHASGEVASKMAVDTVAEHFRNTAEDAELTWPYKLDGPDKYDANRLTTGIKLANLRIFRLIGTRYLGAYPELKRDFHTYVRDARRRDRKSVV